VVSRSVAASPTVADVVGAGGRVAGPLAVVHHRPQADADARGAAQRANHAHEGQRTVLAAEVAVAGAEVEDLNGRAGVGVDLGAQDRRVAQVALDDLGGALHVDGPQALGVGRGRVPAAQQGAEHRVAVDPRRAGPEEAAGAVDQGAGRTVADREEVEGRAQGRLSGPDVMITAGPSVCWPTY
jgi:hypothetical protein